jgi:beta-lactamase regulating signal transducer with metallopeptidase domain
MTFFAQFAVARVFNSLPEGLLIAFCAWLLLRLMGRQNSGTRFSVWLIALAGVVALPLLAGFSALRQDVPRLLPHAHPGFAVPAFWAAVFFLLWIAIAVLGLARVAVGIWQVRQIRRNCTEVPPAELDPELRVLLAESRRPVRLLTSENVRVPAALGFRHPAIVLPAWALRELTPAELRPILIHELAHLRRHDDWTNLFQKAVRAIFFFHPAVWWIDARLSLEREMACDDAVVAATGNPRAYAGCLIDLLEKGCERRGWTMAQAAVARARDVSLRIARILRVGSGASTRVGRAALGLVSVASLACAVVALCLPRLVEFVPVNPASSAQIDRPLVNAGIRFAASGVVPAAYRPQEKPGPQPPMVHRALATRKLLMHAPAVRQAVAHSSHPAQNPVVRASLIAPDPTGSLPMPTLVVFETTTSAAGLTTSAQLHTVGADPLPSPARQLQSREDPALEIQVFQIIDPQTGTPVQILRVVLIVPQSAGGIPQTI